MGPVTVLVIADGAEAALLCATLAKQRDVRVLEAADVQLALERLRTEPAPVALAIAGAAVLGKSADELVKALEPRGVPVIGIAAGLSQKAKKRALAAGVKEIHDRPREWRPYSGLIESVIRRFTRTG